MLCIFTIMLQNRGVDREACDGVGKSGHVSRYEANLETTNNGLRPTMVSI